MLDQRDDAVTDLSRVNPDVAMSGKLRQHRVRNAPDPELQRGTIGNEACREPCDRQLGRSDLRRRQLYRLVPGRDKEVRHKVGRQLSAVRPGSVWIDLRDDDTRVMSSLGRDIVRERKAVAASAAWWRRKLEQRDIGPSLAPREGLRQPSIVRRYDIEPARPGQGCGPANGTVARKVDSGGALGMERVRELDAEKDLKRRQRVLLRNQTLGQGARLAGALAENDVVSRANDAREIQFVDGQKALHAGADQTAMHTDLFSV